MYADRRPAFMMREGKKIYINLPISGVDVFPRYNMFFRAPTHLVWCGKECQVCMFWGLTCFEFRMHPASQFW